MILRFLLIRHELIILNNSSNISLHKSVFMTLIVTRKIISGNAGDFFQYKLLYIPILYNRFCQFCNRQSTILNNNSTLSNIENFYNIIIEKEIDYYRYYLGIFFL